MGLSMPECGQFRAVPTSVLPYEYLDVTRSCDHEKLRSGRKLDLDKDEGKKGGANQDVIRQI